MAFEVIFKYYEKLGICEYDKTKELELKKTFGDLQSDFPLEKLASVILGQMARRDILVYDVEIYEFTKKKIPFKENKNSISIKNKKFYLGLENIVVSDNETQLLESNCCNQAQVVEPTSKENIQVQPQIQPQVPKPAPVPPQPISMIGNRKPIKRVVFSPSDLKYLRGKPWRFTPNKEYLVYKERFAENGVGMLYLMLDDRNREFEVQDEFFIQSHQNLIGENEEVSFKSNNDLLNWNGNSNGSDMPKLR
jgi:hypothetical protein